MWPPRVPSTRRAVAALCCAGLVAGLAVGVGVTAAPAAAGATAELISVNPAGSVRVHWRGNGHGHGMSQYGARGAAIKGLTAAQIVAFYYPGTTSATIPASTIRVRISGTTTYPTVYGHTPGLRLSGYGALPTTGYSSFRLVPSGSGLALQGRTSKWKTLKTGLAARADFTTSKGWVQLFLADGTSTRYYGSVGAVRSGAGEWTINRVALDKYVQGSVPREVPASWEAAAVRAQAIASRSYAEYERTHFGPGNKYDICDNTMCQMYGGMAHYDANGSLLWRDDPAALTGNANTVLRYRGAPVFAQYSASNGGATVDGGQPYLVGKTDPYDTAASGDPYLDQSTSVRASSLAAGYGLKRVTSLQITARDGHGPWGGRVVSAYVNGTTSSGKSAHVATDGSSLGGALGVWTDYLRFDQVQTAPSAPTALRVVPGDAGATVSWAPPSDTGHLAVTAYRVRFPGHTRTLAATARSTWVGPLSNLAASTVTVEAVNAAGTGPRASASARPQAAPQRMTALPAKRLVRGALASHAHPYKFAPTGHGNIPSSGVRSVQLAVTVRGATRSGALSVLPSGAMPAPLAAIAYRAGRTTTTTVSVPLVPSRTVVFRPSAGQVRITVDQEAYTAATGSRLQTVGRPTIANLARVPTGRGRLLSLAGLRGISASTRGVLVAVDARGRHSTTLRLWSGAGPAPVVQHVTISPYASNTNVVVVPVGRRHQLRIAAGKSGVSARVTLLGVLGSSGGSVETFPATAIVDDAAARHSRRVGTAPVHVAVGRTAQVPSSGVQAVLVHVTVRSAGRAGALWAYPAGTKRSAKPRVVLFPATGSTTATALVRTSGRPAIELRSSVPGVHVSLDAIGYVTAR